MASEVCVEGSTSRFFCRIFAENDIWRRGNFIVLPLKLKFQFPISGLLPKTLGFNITISPIRKGYYIQNPPLLSSSRYISSDKTAIGDSFTVNYLINSCGLSPESALTISQRLHLQTPHRPDSVLSLLKHQGFSLTQISNLVKKYPKILLCRAEETLLPKLGFFFSEGLSCSDIYQILLCSPVILHRSLKNRIIPTFNFLKDFLQSVDKVVTVIKRSKIILYGETQIALRIKILLENGVSESSIVKLLLYCPRAFTLDVDKFRNNVQKAREIGIDPAMSVFFKAVIVLLGMSKPTWERKVNTYKRWGWSEEEILTAFRTQPYFMAMSENKIASAMDLFVNKLGWEIFVIKKRPLLISLSLERKLLPRASVLQFLISKGLIKKSFRTTAFFECPEKEFIEKFVVRYDESSQILKLYKEKLEISSQHVKKQ